MNIRQVFFISFSFFISLSVLAADRSTQPVRTEVYRLERRDSVLLVDLAVDLTSVRLAPDCTVYLIPLRARPAIHCRGRPVCAMVLIAICCIAVAGPWALLRDWRRFLLILCFVREITPCPTFIIESKFLMRHGWKMRKCGCGIPIAIAMPAWYLLPCRQSRYRHRLYNGRIL